MSYFSFIDLVNRFYNIIDYRGIGKAVRKHGSIRLTIEFRKSATPTSIDCYYIHGCEYSIYDDHDVIDGLTFTESVVYFSLRIDSTIGLPVSLASDFHIYHYLLVAFGNAVARYDGVYMSW